MFCSFFYFLIENISCLYTDYFRSMGADNHGKKSLFRKLKCLFEVIFYVLKKYVMSGCFLGLLASIEQLGYLFKKAKQKLQIRDFAIQVEHSTTEPLSKAGMPYRRLVNAQTSMPMCTVILEQTQLAYAK